MDIIIDRPLGNEPGELTSSEIKRQLAKAAGQPIVVRIHSEGGSVFEGLAIYDALKAYTGQKRCIIESAAFSMASVLAMAFDDRTITPNGYMMVHSPYLDDGSTLPILASLRDRLSAIYSAATRKPRAFIDRLMAGEVFMDASESLRNGFVTGITAGSVRAVAMLRDMTHKHPQFKACIVARLGSQTTAKGRWNQAVSASMAGGLDRWKAIVDVDRSHPGLRLKMIDEANGR
jgi:ATP-dependent protease ClpP protease subunit